MLEAAVPVILGWHYGDILPKWDPGSKGHTGKEHWPRCTGMRQQKKQWLGPGYTGYVLTTDLVCLLATGPRDATTGRLQVCARAVVQAVVQATG
jgi:hypothetical protein